MSSQWWYVSLIVSVMLVGCGRQQTAQSMPPTAAESSPMSPAMSTEVAVPRPVASVPVAELPGTIQEIGGPIEIQAALANAGYYAGPIDGKLGSMAQQAIKEFQRAQGLTADGRIGPKTWAVLRQFLVAPPSSTSSQ